MTYSDEKLTNEVINHTKCTLLSKVKMCRWNFDKNQHLLNFVLCDFGENFLFWRNFGLYAKVICEYFFFWEKQTKFKTNVQMWKKSS